MRVIMLDAGHGHPDPGAVGAGGLKERDVALDIVLRMRAWMLGEGDFGLRVELTREGKSAIVRGDKRADLDMRCKLANQADAACFVSIHCNAAESSSAHGFEHWTSPGWTRADPLATAMWTAMRQEFPDRRGRLDTTDGDVDKESRFRVLVGTAMPAVLVEVGFVSNPEEELWLADDAIRERIARCQADAVLDWMEQDGAPA